MTVSSSDQLHPATKVSITSSSTSRTCPHEGLLRGSFGWISRTTAPAIANSPIQLGGPLIILYADDLEAAKSNVE